MKLLDRFLRIIVKAQPRLVLHDQNNADEEETVVGSSGNARTGVSIAVYKPREFDASNPVYEVETWDADDNMTERMVNISEVDPADCDEVEMTAYTWYLSNSGKCPAAFLLFAGAREHRQTSRPGYSSDSVFEKSNWVELFREYMQMQYMAGNRKGYLEHKMLLKFLE